METTIVYRGYIGILSGIYIYTHICDNTGL